MADDSRTTPGMLSKWRPLALALAFVAMLPAGPLLLLEGKTWPDTACAAVVDAWARIEIIGRLYHDLKNLLVELFRCDAQWWAKETLFVVWLLLIWAVVATVKAMRK